MTRLILNALRMANQPQTTEQVTLSVMRQRGFDTENQRLRRQMMARTRYALRQLRHAERVQSETWV
jgi:hypothetical protein